MSTRATRGTNAHAKAIRKENRVGKSEKNGDDLKIDRKVNAKSGVYEKRADGDIGTEQGTKNTKALSVVIEGNKFDDSADDDDEEEEEEDKEKAEENLAPL